MREILAYAASLFEESFHRCRNFCRLHVETEILVNTTGEIEHCGQERTAGRKRIARVIGQVRLPRTRCLSNTNCQTLRISSEGTPSNDF